MWVDGVVSTRPVKIRLWNKTVIIIACPPNSLHIEMVVLTKPPVSAHLGIQVINEPNNVNIIPTRHM